MWVLLCLDYTAPLAVDGTPKTEFDSASLPISPPVANRFARLQRIARWRRLLAPLLLLVPTAVVLGMDLSRRSARLAGLERSYQGLYLASLLESLLLWIVLVHAASRRRGALSGLAGALFVIAFTFSVGGQTYFYSQYNAYLNLDVSRSLRTSKTA